MNKILLSFAIVVSIMTSLLLTSCGVRGPKVPSTLSTNTLIEKPTVVSINSLDDLNTLFENLQYIEKKWKTSGQEIPRITFNSVGEKWVKDSPKLPVNTKKSIFFRLMTPLILASNENILKQREIVKNDPLNSQQLIDIAQQYRVLAIGQNILTEPLRDSLLTRVDIIPVSLALAQAAEESGWATSRFALQGNAFFGQWDFSGNGMKPKQQREHLGNYGVARFDSPLDSVEAYMLNLNTNTAYKKLRTLRADLKNKNQKITGYQLASSLDKYSERGEDYISGLRQLIKYNKLQSLDNATLSNEKWIHLNSGHK